MKKKVTTMLLTISLLSMTACGKQETTATEETVPTTVESAQTEIIEEIKETTDDTVVSEDETSSSETVSSETTRTDYPDSNPEHRKAWNDFCNNWNESDYGTTTKGKTQNDFPYYGRTGYDSSLLEYRTTDKGYTVMYDTATGRVYYTGMTLPTGDAWDDTTSGGVLASYEMSKGYNGFYDITYAEMQELLGTYAGD